MMNSIPDTVTPFISTKIQQEKWKNPEVHELQEGDLSGCSWFMRVSLSCPSWAELGVQ